MKHEPSLRRNTFLNLFSSGLSILFPIITFSYASHILQPELLGRVSLAHTVVSYFLLFATLGIPVYGTRKCASVQQDQTKLSQTTVELLLLEGILTLIAGSAFFLCVQFIPQMATQRPLYYILGISFLLQFLSADWYFKGQERYGYLTVIKLLSRIVGIILLFLLVRQRDDYLIYGLFLIISSLGGGICNAIVWAREITWKAIRWPTGACLKVHIKPIFLFFLMSCAVTIYTNLDTLMLGFIKGDTTVGYYTVSCNVKIGLALISGSLTGVTLPRATKLWAEQKQLEFFPLGNKALSLVCFSQIAFTVYFFIFAKEIVLVLSGESYLAAVPSLRILLFSVIPIGISNVVGNQLLIPTGNEKQLFISELAAALFNLILNGILIPFFGTVGAAASTVFAEIIVAVVSWYYMKQKLHFTFDQKQNIVQYAVGAVFSGLLSGWIVLMHFPPIIKLALSAGIYFSVYYIWLRICKNQTIYDVFNREKPNN